MQRSSTGVRGWVLVATALYATGGTWAADGQGLFDQHCALCHGIGGTGGRGPSLTRPTLVRAADEAALKKVIEEGIPPEMPGTWLLDEAAVADLAAYVRTLGKVAPVSLPGDAARGAQLYQANRCASCHTITGQGSSYGPDLSEIGARRSAAYLEESLRKPAAALPEGFMLMKVRPASGRPVEGVRLTETNFSVHLRDAAGRTHSFTTAQLAGVERLRGQTTMPAYDRSLTPAQIEDLVAYLASLRGTP